MNMKSFRNRRLFLHRSILLGPKISRCNAEASKANFKRLRVRRQQEIYQETQRFNVVRSIDLRPQRR